jgi:hypothetical protein
MSSSVSQKFLATKRGLRSLQLNYMKEKTGLETLNLYVSARGSKAFLQKMIDRRVKTHPIGFSRSRPCLVYSKNQKKVKILVISNPAIYTWNIKLI